jgi:MFS family permease
VLAPGFFWLVGAQMLVGLGSSVTRLASLTVVVGATPRTAMGRANSLLEFTAIAGIVCSPIVSGLTTALLHWRAAFGLSTLFVAAAFVWVLCTRWELAHAVCAPAFRINPHADTAASARAPHHKLSTSPARVWAVGIAYLATFVLSFTWAGFIALAMPLYGGEVLHIPPAVLGSIFTAGLLVDLALLLPIGWLSDRLGYHAVLAPAMLLMAAMLVWLPKARSPVALLIVSVGLHTGFAAWGMPAAALVLLTRGDRLARTMGFYRLLVDGAVVIAPWLVGILIGQYGYELPARLSAALVTLTALLVVQGLRLSRSR